MFVSMGNSLKETPREKGTVRLVLTADPATSISVYIYTNPSGYYLLS